MSSCNDVSPVQEDIGTSRWDYRISDKDNFFIRYNIYKSNGYTPGINPLTNNVITNQQQLGTVSLVHVFGPTTTMDLRTGVNRLPTSQTYPGAPDPGINVSGILSITGGYQYNAATAYTYAGDVTKVRGRHTLAMGFEYHTTRVNRDQRGNNVYNFLASSTQLSNFFQNIPDQLASASVIGGNSGGSGSVSAYFEDSFKQSRKLTLTAGLRYDYYLRPTEKFGRIIGLEGSPFPLSNLQFKKPGDEVINPDYLGFGPRLGVAYTPTARTVIRGGFGIFLGLNYPALTTAAAYTFVPPAIPADLYDPYYAQTAITFTRQQLSNLSYPNISFLTPQALLQNAPAPSPNFPMPDWRNTESAQYKLCGKQDLEYHR
jgi:outer membrane receptor protein involved in Fe transport